MAERRRIEPTVIRDGLEQDELRSTSGPREQSTVLKHDLANFPDFCNTMSGQYKIDKNDLDGVVMWQAEAVTRINDVYAHLVSLRDEAEEEIKLVRSEVDASIRAAVTKDGGGKLTEDAIKQLIIRDRRTLGAQRKYEHLKRDCARIDALRGSYKDRGYMIRAMVDLYISGYFADRSGVPRRSPYDDRERGRQR